MGVITFYHKFSRRIGSLLGGDFTDAFLLVEGVEIPVHRCILAAHSEYFKHLFSQKKDSRNSAYQRGGSHIIAKIGDSSPSNNQSLIEISDVTLPLSDNVIELENTKVKVVRAVLDYFYRGKYDYHKDVGSHLLALELAHRFRLRDLEETLIDHLVKSITLENFVQFYNLKMLYKNVELENSCVRFLTRNGEEIARSDSFSKLTSVSLLSLLDDESFSADEIDIFRAAERWAAVNKPNKTTVKDIVEKIRLAIMSMEDLFDVVSTSKDLPSIDIMEPIRKITKKDAASANFRKQAVQDPPADLNVAKSSLGAKVLSGTVTGIDLISGSRGCTFHLVGGKPDCIAVKLNQTYRLNALQILLDSSDGRSYKYHVEVSVNEREWMKVVDHSNYWCRNHQFLRFDPMAVRFIKMTGADDDLRIVSLEAMYTNKICSIVQGIPVASTNVALASRGATVFGDFDPMHCIDGKENSSARVYERFPLIIKLGQPYRLSTLRVKLNAWGNSYTIESSPDGESWHPIGGEKKGERGRVWRSFDFSRRVVLQFRVTMKRIDTRWCVALYHIESPSSTIVVTKLKHSQPIWTDVTFDVNDTTHGILHSHIEGNEELMSNVVYEV